MAFSTTTGKSQFIASKSKSQFIASKSSLNHLQPQANSCLRNSWVDNESPKPLAYKKVSAVFGKHQHKNQPVLSIEEMDAAIAAGLREEC